MDAKPKNARRGASLAIAIVGLIHLVLAKEYLSEQAYLGVLFIAGGLTSLYVAARLWVARDVVAWTVGALVAAGMFVGFVLSRTVGLPGFKEGAWELSGVISLVLEAGYLGALVVWLRRRTRTWVEESLPRPVGETIERAGRFARDGAPVTRVADDSPHARLRQARRGI